MTRGSSQEKSLLQGMRRGDPSAFTLLVDTYGAKIHALSRSYAINEADAEDLTQESLIEICRSVHSFRGDAAFSTFVYRIAINRCLKYRERQKSHAENTPLDGLPLSASDHHDPERQVARSELTEQVHGALASLSEGHREVVILHELHGLTYAECAEALNIPIGTVKSRLFHAFCRLRERLTDYIRGEESESATGEKGIVTRQTAIKGTIGGRA